MTNAEIEVALRTAFAKCNAAGFPLTTEQQQLILQAVVEQLSTGASRPAHSPTVDADTNPLDELTPEQRQTFLAFVHDQEQSDRSWKSQLLNDWLAGRDSGTVQFVRDIYGLSWLERVQPVHFEKYAERTLKVGDRLEVSNSLWEWVQDDGPCHREWFPCTVINLITEQDTLSPIEQTVTRCLVRFENGMEYEIQGVYEWNRYNWRWADLESNP